MSDVLKNRSAIITGAGQGIGQGVARAFAAEGAKLLITQRSRDAGEAEAQYLRSTFGADVEFLETDVTDKSQVDRMVATAIEKFGGVDILVNNAGAIATKRLENHSDEEMDFYFDTNFRSVFWAMKAVFPHMKNRSYGRIINMGSLNGVNAHMYTAAYNASKEAMRALSRTAAVEWGQYGITVNVICPAVSSPMAEAFFEENPEFLKSILADIPVGRLGNAEADVGPVALFLASKGSQYCTGETMFVSGGSHVNGVSWRPQIED